MTHSINRTFYEYIILEIIKEHLMRLHHVACVCGSLENTARFYEDIVGLRRIKTSTLNKELAEQIFDISLECEMVTYGNENFNIEIFVGAHVPKNIAGFGHFCLQVGDREDLLRMCESAGLTVKRVPKGDSVVTFVKDFDGNLIEVKGSQ